MSSIGTPRITNGMTRGAKKKNVWPLNWSAVRPPTRIVLAASSRPRNSAPASPMKILAGWALRGRNPTHTPTAMIATSGARFDPASSPESDRRKE